MTSELSSPTRWAVLLITAISALLDTITPLSVLNTVPTGTLPPVTLTVVLVTAIRTVVHPVTSYVGSIKTGPITALVLTVVRIVEWITDPSARF